MKSKKFRECIYFVVCINRDENCQLNQYNDNAAIQFINRIIALISPGCRRENEIFYAHVKFDTVTEGLFFLICYYFRKTEFFGGKIDEFHQDIYPCMQDKKAIFWAFNWVFYLFSVIKKSVEESLTEFFSVFSGSIR